MKYKKPWEISFDENSQKSEAALAQVTHTENKSADEIAAEKYVEGCDWSYNLYGDKSDMDWKEQKKYPSDIPTNLKLAFLEGIQFEREKSKRLVEALERMQAGYAGMFGDQGISAKDHAYEMCPDIINEALASYTAGGE